MYEDPKVLVDRQNLIPPRIRARLLFLKEWREPIGFRHNWSMDEKLQFMQELQSISTLPFRTHYWVWFGEYRKPTAKPYYDDQKVVPLLYRTLIGPLPPKARLTYVKTNTYTDVNPFKYEPASKNREIRFNLAKEEEKERSLIPVKTQMCVENIKELFGQIPDNATLDRMRNNLINQWDDMDAEIVDLAIAKIKERNNSEQNSEEQNPLP